LGGGCFCVGSGGFVFTKIAWLGLTGGTVGCIDWDRMEKYFI